MFDGFFGYLVGGAVVGILARLIKPGPDRVGILITILIGALGAALAGSLVGGGIVGWAVAIVAAIVLLFAYDALRGGRRRTPRR